MNRSRSNHSAASSRSMWCCSPHPQQVQVTFSVLDSKTSSQVIISLITEISISDSQKIASIILKKIKKVFFIFLHFRLDFTLWAPARCRVRCQRKKLVFFGILPHDLPIVRGVGQVARSDFALNGRLFDLGESDRGLQTSVTSLKPTDRAATPPNRSVGIFNEVFMMYSHNRKKNSRNFRNVNPNLVDYFDFFWGERRSQRCFLSRV